MKSPLFVNYMNNITQGSEKKMSFTLNRINPNQTQVLFFDGRFETLTNEELDLFLNEMGIAENISSEQQMTE